MPQCAVIASINGQEVFAPDPAGYAVGQPCAALVVLTPDEYAQALNNPFALSIEGGAAVATAVLSLWVLAWAWKQLQRALNTDGSSTSQE